MVLLHLHRRQRRVHVRLGRQARAGGWIGQRHPADRCGRSRV